jgi:tRNA pseudouridine32 synthase/23S rRNA pseudouridine746 synthase
VSWRAEDLVLWSDEAIVVANKPAGLLVIRGGFAPEPYLAQILEAAFGRLWVVHRVDRDTSGVVVFARSAAAHRELNTQFEARDVAKVYHALVVGVPPWDERQVDLPLRRDGDRRHRTVVDTRGKPSSTRLKVLERLRGHALLEALPRTGRTHQIRAHLSALGHPVLGDELYGGEPKIAQAEFSRSGEGAVGANHILIARSALHALSITLAHPTGGETRHFSAPYPEDFSRTLSALRKAARD